MLGKRRRFWFFIGAAIMFLYFLITNNPDPNKPISRNQVISTEMSIVVYTRTGDGGAHVRKQIIVSRKSRFNRDSKYILDQKDLRDFMDQKLEGTYFGEDTVSVE